jgi:hypothetical protein
MVGARNRRIVVTLGPLEEWRGQSRGETVRFASDGTPGGLKVAGTFQKTLMGMPNPSQVSVFNLAQDTRNAIRGSLTKITVQAGRQNTELHTLFQGSILSAVSERSGADILTRISALPGYGALVRGVSSRTYAAGTPVRDVVRDMAADLPGLAVADSGIEGLEGTIGNSGWSFAGSTKDGLTRLANEWGFSWHVDSGQFRAVGDRAGFGGLVELSGHAGNNGYNGRCGGLVSIVPLLTGPLQIQTGVKIKALYVPGVTAGSTVRVNSSTAPRLNSDYRVHTCTVGIDAYSDNWIMDIESFR